MRSEPSGRPYSLKARRILVVIGGGVLCAALGLTGCAGDRSATTGSGGVSTESDAPLVLPLRPNPAYANLPHYLGSLGGRKIEMRLGLKPDGSGVHGEYHFVDDPAMILLAGDLDGTTLEVEESNDGTHITGNWVGRFNPDGSASGERMNDDDSNPQPFTLTPVKP
jgi:hypothetical protein